jgi:hypothetical protein
VFSTAERKHEAHPESEGHDNCLSFHGAMCLYFVAWQECCTAANGMMAKAD